MIRNQVVNKFQNTTNNCVLFVRQKISGLPMGLTNMADKIHKKNRELGKWGDPWKTAVFMKMSDPHGHVAIFTGWSIDENGNNVLSLQDSNIVKGFVTNRVYWGSSGESQAEVEKGAGIVGYWVAPA